MKAVFLDRDGVVNSLVYHLEQQIIDSPFTPDQFKLLPGVPEAINRLHQSGYYAVLVSNQPGIAKGHMSFQIFDTITQKMRGELNKAGASLDGEYYCLHHPESVVDQLRAVCNCRKPQPGLILQAAENLDIDLGQSWIIGDNLSDIKAGRNAGCKTILLGEPKCEFCRLMDAEKVSPDKISPDILDAVQYIFSCGGEYENIYRFCECK